MARVPPSRRQGGRGHPLHDACAVAWLMAPELFATCEVHAAVERAGASRGRTNIARFRLPGPANAVWLERLDTDGFFALLDESLAKLP